MTFKEQFTKRLNLNTCLETDVKKMIIYMLKKGNLVLDTDYPRLIPTENNLKMIVEVFDN